jgi:shikimate kinase
VVLLTVTPEAVESRLGNGRRPLVPDVEAWKAVYAKRESLYRSLADHTADTSSIPTERVASDVVSWLTARGDAARSATPTTPEESIR